METTANVVVIATDQLLKHKQPHTSEKSYIENKNILQIVQMQYSQSHTQIKTCIYIYTVSSTNIGTLGKYEQRQLWK